MSTDYLFTLLVSTQMNIFLQSWKCVTKVIIFQICSGFLKLDILARMFARVSGITYIYLSIIYQAI